MNRLSRAAGCLVFLMFGAACLAQGDPWDAPAMTADPATMLRAASSVPAPDGTDIVCLLHQVRYVFEANGRKTRTEQFVYRILTQRGVEAEPASVNVAYRPWHEQRPIVRARVITADGVVHGLDPNTLDDAPAQDGDETYTDRRILRGPLPAVAIGALVEKEYTTAETVPEFDAGVTASAALDRPYPVRHTRIIIDAPASLPLRYATELLSAIKVEKAESGGRVVVTFDQGNLDPEKDIEPFLPAEAMTWPQVIFATAQSWQAVAARYAQLVDEKIAAGKPATTKITGKTREQVATELLARLHREVRYTGVEFGEAAFIPQSPAEVLKRKYGDCKDKATLLVAMLRESSMPAYLALLSTGPGRDVRPEMPGFGEFDHAIVYVPGSPELWIDATAEFAPVGQLPASDQGRLALVVRPETTVLVRTPEARSTDNLVVETREFFLAELGPARVVETTEAWGGSGEWYRGEYGGPVTKEIREDLTNYAKSNYLTEAAPKIEHSEPADFSGPFRLRLEVEKAKRGTTTLVDAAVGIPMWNLVARLPRLFTDEPDSSEGSQSAVEEEPKRRQGDLVMPEPFVTEWRYRIVPPPGFKPSPLPQGGTTQMGPAVLTKQFNEKDGVVTATLRFDSVKRRYTADEVEALKAAVRDQAKAKVTLITFEQIGHSYLAAGKVREALGEFNKLVALHPKEALHHAQLARAFLEAGVGDAARAEARHATELQPDSADAFAALGWILEHDLVGRRFKKGFDLAGATAAYRKAVELDPTNMAQHIDFAILLEHNGDGIRYGSGCKPDEALAQYELAKDNLEDSGAVDNPLFLRMRARRYPELKAAAQALPTTARRRAFTLVALAATDGAPAAIQDAEKISTVQERSTALATAAQMLLSLRLYPQAADLLEAGARGTEQAANSMARAQIIRRARRYEEVALPATDPRSAFMAFQRMIVGSTPMGDNFFELFSETAIAPSDRKRQLEGFKAVAVTTRLTLEKQGVDPDVVLDVGSSSMQLLVEGDDATGYRIREQVPGQQGRNFFVVQERGKYRILDLGSDLGAVGKRALALAGKGELDRARRVLDWAREEQRLEGGDDPFAGKPFPRFWTKGQDADADAVRFAAAALASSDWDAAAVISVLQQGRSKAASDSDRIKFDLALAQAYTKAKRWSDLLTLGQGLLEANPASASAFRYATDGMMHLEKWQDWEQLVQERLQRLPDDADALRSLSRVKNLEGQFKSAQEVVQRVIALGKADVNDYNNLVWSGLLDGTLTEELVQTGYRSTMNNQAKNAPMLHTLAAAYAELGKTKEARELLLQAMDAWGLEEPNSEAWYVFGRIAEQYGARDAANAAYKRVEAPEEKSATVVSTWALAQRRLKSLASPTATPAGKAK